MQATKSNTIQIRIHQTARRAVMALHRFADDMRANLNPAPSADMPADWNLPGTLNSVRLQQYHQRLGCRSWVRS